MADDGKKPEDREKLTPEKTSNENDSAQKRRRRFAENRGEAQTRDTDPGEASDRIPGQPHTTSSRRLDTEIRIADDTSIDDARTVATTARPASTRTDDASVPSRILKRQLSGEFVIEQTSEPGLSSSAEPVASTNSDAAGVSIPPKSRGIIATLLSPISRSKSPKKEETPGSGKAAAKKSPKTWTEKLSSMCVTRRSTDSEVYIPEVQTTSSAESSRTSQSTSSMMGAPPSSSIMTDSRPPKLKKYKCPFCGSFDESVDLDTYEPTTESGALRSFRHSPTLTGWDDVSVLEACIYCCRQLCASPDSESTEPPTTEPPTTEPPTTEPPTTKPPPTKPPHFPGPNTLSEVSTLRSSGEEDPGCGQTNDESLTTPSTLPESKSFSISGSFGSDESSESRPSTPLKRKMLSSSGKTPPKAKISKHLKSEFHTPRIPEFDAPAKESRKSTDAVIPIIESSLASLGFQSAGTRGFAEIHDKPSSRPDPTPSPFPSGRQMLVDESANSSGRENLPADAPTEKVDEARDLEKGLGVDDSPFEKQKPEEDVGSI